MMYIMRVSTEKGMVEVVSLSQEGQSPLSVQLSAKLMHALGILVKKRLEGACYIQALYGFLSGAGEGAIPESIVMTLEHNNFAGLGVRAVHLTGATNMPAESASLCSSPALWMQFTNDTEVFPGALPQVGSSHAELLLTDQGVVRFGGTLNDGHNLEVGSTPVRADIAIAGTLGDRYLANGVSS
jgi:hypothetical protein